MIAFPEAAVEGVLDAQKVIQEPQNRQTAGEKRSQILNAKLKKLMEEDESE